MLALAQRAHAACGVVNCTANEQVSGRRAPQARLTPARSRFADWRLCSVSIWLANAKRRLADRTASGRVSRSAPAHRSTPRSTQWATKYEHGAWCAAACCVRIWRCAAACFAVCFGSFLLARLCVRCGGMESNTRAAVTSLNTCTLFPFFCFPLLAALLFHRCCTFASAAAVGLF